MGPRVNGMQAFLSHLAEFLPERYFWGSNSHCLLPQPALAPPPRAAGAQCSCRWHIDGSYGDRACPCGAVPLLHRPAELGVWWSVPVPIPAPVPRRAAPCRCHGCASGRELLRLLRGHGCQAAAPSSRSKRATRAHEIQRARILLPPPVPTGALPEAPFSRRLGNHFLKCLSPRKFFTTHCPGLEERIPESVRL